MSCYLGCSVPCTGRVPGSSQHDLTFNLQIRMAGPALTSLKTYDRRPPNPSGGSSRGVGIAAAAAAQKSAHDRSDGTLAETLIDGVTQSLALGLSAASIAADSLDRIQRVVAPLPAGFPPGVVCMHGGHVLTARGPMAICHFFPVICGAYRIVVDPQR